MIKKENDGKTIKVSVSDFAQVMGYCEYMLIHILEGREVPITKIMEKGGERHKKEEKMEEELRIPVPTTIEEIMNVKENLIFKKELVRTRFVQKEGKDMKFICQGRVDKVFRIDKTLYIEEVKFVQNPYIYNDMEEPFLNQKLQTMLYSISEFNLTGSFKNHAWVPIPHRKKVCVVRIKNMNEKIDKMTGEYPDHKIFMFEVNKKEQRLLKEKINRFQDLVLGKEEYEHHNNPDVCKSCLYVKYCSYKI